MFAFKTGESTFGQQIEFGIFVEPRNIDRQDDVGRAGLTFGEKTLRQSFRRIEQPWSLCRFRP